MRFAIPVLQGYVVIFLTLRDQFKRDEGHDPFQSNFDSADGDTPTTAYGMGRNPAHGLQCITRYLGIQRRRRHAHFLQVQAPASSKP